MITTHYNFKKTNIRLLKKIFLLILMKYYELIANSNANKH